MAIEDLEQYIKEIMDVIINNKNDKEVKPDAKRVPVYDKLYKAFRDIFDHFSNVCYQLNT